MRKRIYSALACPDLSRVPAALARQCPSPGVGCRRSGFGGKQRLKGKGYRGEAAENVDWVFSYGPTVEGLYVVGIACRVDSALHVDYFFSCTICRSHG